MPRLSEEDPLVRRDRPLVSVHTPAEEDERTGHAPRVIYLGELASDPAAVDLPDDAVARIFSVAGELKCALAGTVYVLAPPVEPEDPQDDTGGIGLQTVTTSATAISGLSLSLEDGEYILMALIDISITATGTGGVIPQLYLGGAAAGNDAEYGDDGSGSQETVIVLASVETVSGGPKTFEIKIRKNNAGGTASTNKARDRIIAFVAAGSAIATVGGGDTTLIAHTDTPASYASQALKGLRVNSGESAVEFADIVSAAMARIGASTFSTLQHLQDIFHSAGWTSGGTINDAGSGNITVDAGTGLVRSSDSQVAELLWFDWSALGSTAIPSNTERYIGVEYNAGSPQVVVHTSYDWNFNTDFPLGNVVNDAGTLHIENAPHAVADHANFMIQRLYGTQPFSRDTRTGGLILGETGTRNLTVSTGALWERLSKFTIAAIDTSGADTFDRYYRDGVGGWTEEAAQTAWNNTQYDDGSGTLATMGNNKYAAQYFYLELDGNLVSVYGQTEYNTEGEVEAESPPSPPPRITTQAILIGRVIFQKSASTAEAVESVYVTTFSTAGVTDHGNLAGITADGHHTELHAALHALTAADDLLANAMGALRLILLSADPAGIRLDVLAGALRVREGDDSGYASMLVQALTAISTLTSTSTGTSVAISGHIEATEVAAPSTPAATRYRTYAKDDGTRSHLYGKDDAGDEHDLEPDGFFSPHVYAWSNDDAEDADVTTGELVTKYASLAASETITRIVIHAETTPASAGDLVIQIRENDNENINSPSWTVVKTVTFADGGGSPNSYIDSSPAVSFNSRRALSINILTAPAGWKDVTINVEVKRPVTT